MPSPYGHPQANSAENPPTYTVRASYTADVADLTAATTTCDTAVTLVENDLVLLTEQSTAAENGIYQVGVVASGVAPLTRYEKCRSAAGLPPGSTIFVSEGTARGNTRYVLTTNAPITLDTTSLTFGCLDSISHVGAHALVLTTTGATGVTLPTTGTLATLGGTETLVGKTLTTPTIGDMTNAGHTHANAAGGGQITDAALSAAVTAAKGGTGQAGGYTIGDMVYASAAATLSKLGIGTAMQILRTNAGANAPEWGGVDIGQLPTITAAIGGTGQAGGYAVGDLLYASAAAVLSKLAIGTANQIVKVNAGATAPEYATVSGTADHVTVTPGVGTLAFDVGAHVVQLADVQTLTNKRIVCKPYTVAFVGGADTMAIADGNYGWIDTVTQNSTLTIDNAGAVLGDIIEVNRDDSDAFTVAVTDGVTTWITMTASKFAGITLRFNGTSWIPVGVYQQA